MSLSSASQHTPKDGSIHADSVTSASSSVSFGSTAHKTKLQSATLRSTAHQLLSNEERGILKHVMRLYRQNNSLDLLCISLAKIINTPEKVKLIDLIYDMFPEEMGKEFLRRCEHHISLYAGSAGVRGEAVGGGGTSVLPSAAARPPISQINRTTSLTGFASMRAHSKLRETGSYWDIQRRNGTSSNNSSMESNDPPITHMHPISEPTKKVHMTSASSRMVRSHLISKRYNTPDNGKTATPTQEAIEDSMKNFETIADRVTRQTSKERPRLSNLQDMGFWDESKLEKKPPASHAFLMKRNMSAQGATFTSTRTVSTANINEARNSVSGTTSPLPYRSTLRKSSAAAASTQLHRDSSTDSENSYPLPLPTAKSKLPSASRATSTDCNPSDTSHHDETHFSLQDATTSTSSTTQRRVIFHPQNASILGDSSETTKKPKPSAQRLPLSPLINDSHRSTNQQPSKNHEIHKATDYLCQSNAAEMMAVDYLPATPAVIASATIVTLTEEKPLHVVFMPSRRHSILQMIPIECRELTSIAEVSQAEILGEAEDQMKTMTTEPVLLPATTSKKNGVHCKVGVAVQTVTPEKPPRVDAYQQTGEDIIYDSSSSQTDA